MPLTDPYTQTQQVTEYLTTLTRTAADGTTTHGTASELFAMRALTAQYGTMRAILNRQQAADGHIQAPDYRAMHASGKAMQDAMLRAGRRMREEARTQ